MNNINEYLSKIKTWLFISLIFSTILFFIFSKFNNLGLDYFVDLPIAIIDYQQIQLDKKTWIYLSINIILLLVALVLLYLEKIFGVCLWFGLYLFTYAWDVSIGFVDINTPGESLLVIILEAITYGIVSVVWLKVLLNQNFELSTGKRKIGSSGLIFEEVYRLAERGNAEAQINTGTSYFKGLGVLQDFSQAHMWFNLAAGSGSNVAAKKRDIVAKKMSAQQIAEAQELAKGFLAKQI